MLPALLAGSLALLAPPEPGDAPDAAFDAPLAQLYDGATDTAIAEFGGLRAGFPEDPLPAYFEALALAWKLEQTPQDRSHDADLLRLASLAIARAELRLARQPDDVRALVARGAAHGVQGRLHLFRRDRSGSVRESVAMRADLRRALSRDPSNEDARFGLALYDYYADVLPRALKLLRFVLGIPGGDRERGLLGLRRAAERSRFHRAEALSQLYESAAFYEGDADAALQAIRSLHESYPGAPLWALRLGEHLRDRLGLYPESVATFAEISARAASGHPNFSPVVAGMATLGAAEAQLRDLRLDAARALLGAAAASGPGLEAWRQRLRASLAALERDATAAARGRARRLREAGERGAAAAEWRNVLARRPRDLEAAFCLAEAALDAGRLPVADAGLSRVLRAESPEPAWLGAAARLLLARIQERQGRVPEAVELYKHVFQHPGGVESRRQQAREALARLGAGPEASADGHAAPKHSR